MVQQPKPGSIVHVEFHAREPARVKEFYGKVFGWKFKEMPEMEYTLFEAPSPPNGGLQKAGENLGPGVLNYILSKSIDDTTRKIKAAGGTIVVPKTPIPSVGWFAVFKDPDGTVQALYEDMPKAARASARKTRPSTKKGASRTKATRRRRR
jgi:hypothetical protein